jgi:predicted nucleic acid-binding protein
LFWDSSALIPYLISEKATPEVVPLFEGDQEVVIWWAASVECVSALERRRREGRLRPQACLEARRRLREVTEQTSTVQPHPLVRSRAERLLASHPLRAADALHLAAALVASDEQPVGEGFVTFDPRLREAAEKEGFRALPESG